MSFAFMPVYTGDYLRDTQHLSCSEHGIYIKLLMHCWDQRGPAPWDERKLAGIVNARSADEVEALRRVLGEFFVRMDDGWYNRRMMREIEKAAALSDKKSTAGKLGAAITNSRKRKDIPAPARHVPGSSSADARQEPHTPTPTLTPTTTSTTTPRKSKDSARASRLNVDSLPPEWREDARSINAQIDARTEFDAFADYWRAKPGKDGTKLDWRATWRNWCRRAKPASSGTGSSRHSTTGQHMAAVAQDWLNSKERK